MRDLPPQQRKALAAILDTLRDTGAAPTQGRVAEVSGLGSNAGRALGALQERGYAAQAWDAHGAPWLPLRDLEGRPVKVRCAVEIQEVTP
jgi:hypothetical protein